MSCETARTMENSAAVQKIVFSSFIDLELTIFQLDTQRTTSCTSGIRNDKSS